MSKRIVVLGGGYVGLYTSLGLLRKLRAGEATVTVIDPRSYMTYQPFLPEASAGSLSPRHVVVPLRRVLKGAEIINAHVTKVDHARKVVTVEPLEGPSYEVPYDEVVVALGSKARTLPIPGLAEQGIGFKTVEEAIWLRNHVLRCLDLAASTQDAERRSRALTFTFVGGGYAGVEAIAELEDMARYALRYYPQLHPDELRFVLVEATGRILPEVGEDMGRYTLDELRQRGLDVLLETRLESCVDGHVVLSDGQRFDSDTVVWTAGVKASPVLANTDLPLDDKGRLVCDADLRVHGLADAWGAGDNAAVPDITNPGSFCSPSAQHAVRQATHLADNIVKSLRGKEIEPYRHKHVGSVASLGLHKGVAQVYGVKLRGWPAWFMHRTYHVSRVPTLNRKIRVIVDWTLALFFKREIVSLGEMAAPREEFHQAAGGGQ
ncbi:NAD(P)/FAD-dependent oxidoreductase [Oryzihumus leptocrescens]|uniref:NAD(P)/FAD-dependent oxidoreductase n=1 Tax=Oryzihumus leptocrescens TaxID=297536 RepID=UPI001151E1DC|nr:NAD(P)/FAD-dependent oxidoreductase [Oryzihumus leptocrescens]